MKLCDMAGPPPVTLTIQGEPLVVQALNLAHVALIEQGTGRTTSRTSLEGAAGALDLVVAVLEDAGHLGLPPGATWAQKRSLVARMIPPEEMAVIASQITGSLPKSEGPVIHGGPVPNAPDPA